MSTVIEKNLCNCKIVNAFISEEDCINLLTGEEPSARVEALIPKYELTEKQALYKMYETCKTCEHLIKDFSDNMLRATGIKGEYKGKYMLSNWSEMTVGITDLKRLHLIQSVGVNTAEDYCLLAEAYLKLGDMTKAEKAAQYSIELKPNHKAYEILGDITFSNELVDDALDFYKKSSEIYDETPVINRKLGQCYFLKGHVELAQKYFSLAEGKFETIPLPNDYYFPLIYLGLMQVYEELGDRSTSHDYAEHFLFHIQDDISDFIEHNYVSLRLGQVDIDRELVTRIMQNEILYYTNLKIDDVTTIKDYLEKVKLLSSNDKDKLVFEILVNQYEENLEKDKELHLLREQIKNNNDKEIKDILNALMRSVTDTNQVAREINQVAKETNQVLKETHQDVKELKPVVFEIYRKVEKLDSAMSDIADFRAEFQNYRDSKNHNDSNIEEKLDHFLKLSLDSLMTKVQTRLNEKDLKWAKENLIDYFGNELWMSLEEESKKFLITSEIIFHHLNSEKYKKEIDYSPAVIPLTKTLENEIYNKFYLPLIEFFKKNISIDVNANWPGELVKEKRGTYSLQVFTFGSILNLMFYKWKTPLKKISRNGDFVLIPKFQRQQVTATIRTIVDSEKIFNQNAEIFDPAKRNSLEKEYKKILEYRNDSAHKEFIIIDNALDCKNRILEGKHLLKQFMSWVK